MNKKPGLSIIIPAYNEADDIGACLQSCVNQSPLADEVIVVDNNSTDGTAQIVIDFQNRYPNANIRLVHEKVQGLNAARNRGFAEAKYALYGRIDADTRIEAGWVSAVIDAFRVETVMAISGPMLYHDMPLRRVSFKVDDKIRAALYKQAKDHKFIFGSNMALRGTAWDAIRDILPPDPEENLHEDINIALTLFENDLEIVYVPDMAAGMSARRLEDSPRDYYNYIMRFERTFKAHGVKSARARIPIFIYLLLYFPVRTVRKFYDHETNRFTLNKLREDLATISPNDD